MEKYIFHSAHSVIFKADDENELMFVKYFENANNHMSLWFSLIGPRNKWNFKLGGAIYLV